MKFEVLVYVMFWKMSTFQVITSSAPITHTLFKLLNLNEEYATTNL